MQTAESEPQQEEEHKIYNALLVNGINILVVISMVAIACSQYDEAVQSIIPWIGGTFCIVDLACLIRFIIKKQGGAASSLSWLILMPLFTCASWFLAMLPHSKIGG